MGRPRITTNVDGTTKEITYGGCGCAGGQVVTARDEIGRQQLVVSDPLGRPWKTQVLNMDGTVYSTTTNTYNGRDQITRVFAQQGETGAGQETLMTYDGHGRLATSKAPVQSGPSSYTYDTDDVVLSTTDPRGVVTTFGFTNAANYVNTRHLVNSVTYTNAPTGIPVPSPVSFEYDEAGNRTSMADGSGTHSYSYNALSQLTSETRTFAGVSGGYTIGYTYTVSGQLKTLTDPSGMTVTYGYDGMGRLTGATGSGPGSVASYVSNLRYRAWGAVKSMTYGNGVQLAAQYDARLRETRREFSNLIPPVGQPPVTFGSESQYWADGRVRYARDLQDGNFDRAYDFDHVGRIKEAYSGREARGLPPLQTPDSPLRQTFTYDVWGNMGRTARHWTSTVADAPNYSDDRRSDWTYDAAGNVTVSRSGVQTHAYDAAGEKVHYNEENWSMAGLEVYTID